MKDVIMFLYNIVFQDFIIEFVLTHMQYSESEIISDKLPRGWQEQTKLRTFFSCSECANNSCEFGLVALIRMPYLHFCSHVYPIGGMYLHIQGNLEIFCCG